jgi:hypothetical protein
VKNRKLLNTISISFALISIGVCLTIWGLVSGFEKGYFYGMFTDLPDYGFSTDGTNFYQFINTSYFTILLGLCSYTAGKFIRSHTISNFICLVSLSVALYPFWDMYFFKREILPIGYYYVSYGYWLGVSVYFDWFVLFVVLSLLITQVFLLLDGSFRLQKIEFTQSK